MWPSTASAVRSPWEINVVRSHLARLEIQEAIARYHGRKIAALTIDQRCG